jgi:hypothetical protein
MRIKFSSLCEEMMRIYKSIRYLGQLYYQTYQITFVAYFEKVCFPVENWFLFSILDNVDRHPYWADIAAVISVKTPVTRVRTDSGWSGQG